MFYNSNFWIHEFPRETHLEQYRNQSLQYIVTITNGSLVFCSEIIV